MVQWVYERAVESGIADRVLVATPDSEIADRCTDFGGEAVITRDDHPSGTDRIAEVAKTHETDVYVNVQGDEPLIDPASIAACATPILRPSMPSAVKIDIASVYAFCQPDELENPAVVKVATDLEGFALYFSRYPVPFARNPRTQTVKKHVGIYAYRREALLAFAMWQPTPLEQAESLEQLRFLEHGYRMIMSAAAGSEPAVDTPEQAEEVRAILAARGV